MEAALPSPLAEDTIGSSPGYTISCENPIFQTKMHDIFAGIDASASNMVLSDSGVGSGGEEETRDDHDVSRCVPKKSRDFVRPPKPDFLVHPSRYTKYSLRDTQLSDNKANSQIAFRFLRELEHRQASNGKTEESDGCGTADKHMFKMPEHVVGMPKPKDRKIDKKTEFLSCDKVELEHLEENVSAAEFADEIASRLEESMGAKLPQQRQRASSAPDKFKSVNKKNRSLRNKCCEDD